MNKRTGETLKIPCPDCKKPLHFMRGNWFECKNSHCHVIKVFVRVHRDAIFSKSLFLAARNHKSVCPYCLRESKK